MGRAAFSAFRAYRWWLVRIWQSRAPRLVFFGLNPSRATGDRADPTLRRLLRFAHGWGNRGLWRGRDATVRALLAAEGWPALSLGRTGTVQPRHPLYLRRGERLEPFAPSCGAIPPPPTPLPSWPAFPAATPFT